MYKNAIKPPHREVLVVDKAQEGFQFVIYGVKISKKVLDITLLVLLHFLSFFRIFDTCVGKIN